ncbi:isoprenylcysteine carboxylmethyltransferase family protein [Oscillospiraceae bacterium MB08-C2-2]|nr:isoprenylcysteine carboxylmethyltransferase family protein [Oscillospiraceae bacterium MB08-C2-2]
MVYQILSFATLAAFYSIYIGKMLAQRKKGIQTDHMAKGNKQGSLMTVERLMKLATYSVVVAEAVSILLNRYALAPALRQAGVLIGFAGVAVFGTAVYTMRDSWRAGIPQEDKTAMITDGIYAFSRNPAFVGFYLTYAGILLTFFNWVLLVFTVLSITLLHLQILKEEVFLPTVFGEQYYEYKKQVRRYVGRVKK